MEDLVSVLWEHSTNPTIDVGRLIDAVAYNWLILGTDAHAKNHALLLSGPQVRLAPLYDVASLAPYVTYPPRAKLAQKVGGEHRAGEITAEHWSRLAKASKLDADGVLDRVVQLATNLPRAFEEAIATVDLDDDEQAAARRLVEKIIAWAATAAAQLDTPRRPAAARPARPRQPQQRHPKGTPKGGRFA